MTEKNTSMSPAWQDLLSALYLLSRGASDDISPFHCEHDELMVMSDPTKFSDEEIAQLEQWGFHPDEGQETFYSFRYGSA